MITILHFPATIKGTDYQACPYDCSIISMACKGEKTLFQGQLKMLLIRPAAGKRMPPYGGILNYFTFIPFPFPFVVYSFFPLNFP